MAERRILSNSSINCEIKSLNSSICQCIKSKRKKKLLMCHKGEKISKFVYLSHEKSAKFANPPQENITKLICHDKKSGFFQSTARNNKIYHSVVGKITKIVNHPKKKHCKTSRSVSIKYRKICQSVVENY